MKRVLCIHDLSCVGRASLGVIVPVLSAMGVQACALPTALLSTHTGGFGAPAVQDTAAFAQEALAHYARAGVDFDCIYSGYLAGAAAADVVSRAHALWPHAFKVTDPVLGDGGAFYTGMDEAMAARMRTLCAASDVITPNETEAVLLCGGAEADRSGEALACALHARFGAAAVVTGAQSMNAWCTQEGAGALPFADTGVRYPGTGDLFAAVLTGALLQGAALAQAVAAAASFAAQAVQNTPAQQPPRFGVCFEPLLSRLAP